MKNHNRTSGFTIVEALVTIFISSLIIVSLATLFGTLQRISFTQHLRAEASTLAYERLRRYVFTGARASSFFTCDTTNTGASNYNDLTVNPNALGYVKNSSGVWGVVLSGTLTPSTATISQAGSFTITAVAPFGCSGNNSGTPILVRSTVVYGPQSGDSVTHSEYIGY